MESPLNNPYTTPAANLFGPTSGGSSDVVASGTIAMFAASKPWVHFLSVIVWLGIILSLVFAAFIAHFSTHAMTPDVVERAVFMISAVLYGVFALLCISPAVKLWKYANSFRILAASRSVVDLDKTLHQLRGFWKVVGVMIIIMICLILVALVVLVGIAAMQSGDFSH